MSNGNQQPERIVPTSVKMASWAFGDIIGYYRGTAYGTFIFFFYKVEVGLPVILVGVAFLILIKWYDLKGEKKEKLFAELERKGLR